MHGSAMAMPMVDIGVFQFRFSDIEPALITVESLSASSVSGITVKPSVIAKSFANLSPYGCKLRPKSTFQIASL